MALQCSGGDFGATLEQLLHQVFRERFGREAVTPDGLEAVPMDECLNQRQEEALALAAIFGERFTERIANTVWSITLDFSLFSLSGNKIAQDESRGGERSVNNREICKFYLKSKGCRFGDKCRFKHQIPITDRSGAGSPDLTAPSQPGFSSYSPPEYELEIRFPKGNRYPFQAPIVAFSTNDESMRPAGRLTVTEKLYEQALDAAKISEPIVYTLATLCEDEASMMELLSVSHHKYSTPPPVVAVSTPSLTPAKSKTSKSNTFEETKNPTISSENTHNRRTPPSRNQRPSDCE